MSQTYSERGSHYDYCVKLLMLGDSSVGKTSLVNRYYTGQFNPDTMSTIGLDFRIKTIQISNKFVKMLVWDTSGQEKYCAIAKNYYQNATGIL